MFEATDVLISGVGSAAIGLYSYYSIKREHNRAGDELTEKQKRRQRKLSQKELWEHAAYSTAFSVAIFILMVFNAATTLSHYPFWLRFVVTIACFLTVLYMLRVVSHALFRLYRNTVSRSS